MDVALRERNAAACGFQILFRFPVQVPEQIPVVAALCPTAHIDVHRTVRQGNDHGHRCRVREHPAVAGHQVHQDLHRLADVVVIGDADHDIHTPRVVAAEVLDRGAPDRCVRHVNADTVAGAELGREQAEFADGAGIAGHLDEVAYLERPQEQQHDSGRDILERTLQRQADGEAGRTDDGDDAGGLHAELGQHRNDRDDQDRVADQAGKQRCQHRIEAFDPVETAAGGGAQPSGDPPADNEDEYGLDEAQAVERRHLDEGFVEGLKGSGGIVHAWSPR